MALNKNRQYKNIIILLLLYQRLTVPAAKLALLPPTYNRYKIDIYNVTLLQYSILTNKLVFYYDGIQCCFIIFKISKCIFYCISCPPQAKEYRLACVQIPSDVSLIITQCVLHGSHTSNQIAHIDIYLGSLCCVCMYVICIQLSLYITAAIPLKIYASYFKSIKRFLAYLWLAPLLIHLKNLNCKVLLFRQTSRTCVVVNLQMTKELRSYVRDTASLFFHIPTYTSNLQQICFQVLKTTLQSLVDQTIMPSSFVKTIQTRK